MGNTWQGYLIGWRIERWGWRSSASRARFLARGCLLGSIAPPSHKRDLDLAEPTIFRQAVEILKPGATGRDLIALLDGKAKRTTALDWLAGRAEAPQWALRLLAQKIEQDTAPRLEIAARLKAAPERIGKRAGAINLARYRAQYG